MMVNTSPSATIQKSSSSVADKGVSDIPYTWRLLAARPHPSEAEIDAHVFAGTLQEIDILLGIRDGNDITAVRDWLHENEVSYRLYGRWRWFVGFIRHKIFVGARFEFTNVTDAALFRLSWDSDGQLRI